MQIETLIAQLRELCQTPVAWIIFAAVALRAGRSVYAFVRCPALCMARDLDPAEARARLSAPVLHSWRFLVSMLIGVALAVGGLYALLMPGAGPVALAAIVFGSVILIVEPSRIMVFENRLRAAAAISDGPEAHAFALERMRAAHLERILIEVALAALIGFVVLMI